MLQKGKVEVRMKQVMSIEYSVHEQTLPIKIQIEQQCDNKKKCLIFQNQGEVVCMI